MPETSSGARGMAIGKTTVELVNACSRLMDLLDAPQDIPFFGRLIQREIIYRLLQGTQGQRLRAMATMGDQSHRTAKAVAWLRANSQKPPACGTTGNDRRHEPIYAASPFSVTNWKLLFSGIVFTSMASNVSRPSSSRTLCGIGRSIPTEPHLRAPSPSTSRLRSA